ncbi:class II fructose-bisphosphate aldolase, partial [Candidatus Wolfebacteria bacterium]|nr:class II fructose-bisphosphate aldolase [Candidatus Wolfebacteria bacterium]
MKSLKEYISEAESKKVAIGHFNISDIAGLKAIFESAKELSLPIIIGVSEGEAGFVGHQQTAALIKSLREEYNYPIFLNADHHKSLESIKEAVEAGFDAVLFDAGKLPMEENIAKTKEAVALAKSINPNVLVEAELGYLGASSVILKEIPKDAAIKKEDLTKPEDARRFVKETGIDLLAPAVGNIHGMFKNAPNPALDIERIKELRQAAGVPLVLHGGSGITDSDFTKAIDAGISIIHINTEIRLAWREGLEKALKENPEEIVPYKILPYAVE